MDFLKNPNSIPTEILDKAYDELAKYCKSKNVDVVTFVSDKNNIPAASEHIHKQLPFAARMLFSAKKIHALIEEHHDFIKNKAKEYTKKP